MNRSYDTSPPPGELFREADELYKSLKQQLAGEECASWTHSDVEKHLESKGREILRLLYQSHLALRGTAEPTMAVVGDDGVERSHRRWTGRPLVSLFGPVRLERTGHSARGTDSRFPLDAELNAPPDTYSLEVRRRVAEQASQSSFDATVEAVARTTGATVPKRQAEELASKAAVDFDAFYASTALDVAPEETGELLVLTFDAKGIVMHKEDLRPGTRRAAERKQHKLRKRLSKGEKRNRKRMAMVAAVYTLQPWVRTPETIVRSLGPVRDVVSTGGRPKPEHKRVWASVAKDAETVIREAFDEALTRDPEQRKRWVVLVDGEPHQLRRVHTIAEELDIDIVAVLDVIHMLEYLWKAAHAFHKDGTPEAERWVSERLLRILQGGASSVAGGMRRSATRRKLSKSKRHAVDKAADYLLKYKAMLDYPTYLAAGFPIATGVIEGACRHLVRDRMDITGARWRLKRAEAILKLRALRSSGDFDGYWDFHEQQEFLRNHASRYAEHRPPALARPAWRSPLRLVK